MKVMVQSVNFNADKDLVSFVNEKLDSLERFYDRVVDAEVFLKVQKIILMNQNYHNILKLSEIVLFFASYISLETFALVSIMDFFLVC